MLQIISGKFYDSDNIFHNDCKGILYSNACICEDNDYEYIGLQSVEINNITSYVVSYDNKIQVLPGPMHLSRIGDHEIIRQLKNILSFSLNCVFDEDKSVVEKICRMKGDGSTKSNPSQFIKYTLDLRKNINNEEINSSKKFFKHIIGLKRRDYVNILNCIIAYNASIQLLNEDINLAYSMLVYCLESLTQNYDTYMPVWDDYEQSKKCKLEKVFTGLSETDVEKIKGILIEDEHFKLTQRFLKFTEQYIDEEFYQKKDDRKLIQKDDVKIALCNAYNIRSKYAHMLKPIMKQLTMEDFSKRGDTFNFLHNVFFTYSGLLRITRTIIINFTMSLEVVEKETYDWHSDLPELINLEPAPYYWIWKRDEHFGEGAKARLEGFVKCLIYFRQNIPNMEDVINTYFEQLFQMKEENRHAAYSLGYLYVKLISITDEDKKSYFNKCIEKNLSIINGCCIYNLAIAIMPIEIPKEISWTTEECEKVVIKYNKNKYKANKLRLPPEVETLIYLAIANSAKDDGKNDIQKKWLIKAYYNSNNDIEIQAKIAEAIASNENFDITYILKRIFEY